MTLSFNLIREPWIPCLEPSGRVRDLSLHETLARAHELRAIEATSALETAAIYRLLLAILQRVFSTHTVEAWQKVWAHGCWDAAALERYWRDWEHRFDLFGAERPFYQAADDRVEPRSVVFLIPGMAAAEHYNHAVSTGDLTLPAAAAARTLLVSQTFGLPGICHPQQKLFFSSAPWLIGMVFFAEGDTLFRTLALNLLRYAPGYPRQELARTPDDMPAWEMDDPFEPDRDTPIGYLDYLTWQNRRVRLFPEQASNGLVVRRATMTPGLKLSETVLDPMKHYRSDKEAGLKVLRLNENRSLWRDSSVLLSIHNPGQHQPPAVVSWISTLTSALEAGDGPSRANRYRLLGIGLLSDQAKAQMFRAERMPLPLQYLQDPSLLTALDKALLDAESARGALWAALHQVAQLLVSNEADAKGGRQPASQDTRSLLAHWDAERVYWKSLEMPFWQLMQDLAGSRNEALQDWHTVLRAAAYQAFDLVERLVGSSAGELKALVQGRHLLGASLRKKGILPPAPNHEEVT